MTTPMNYKIEFIKIVNLCVIWRKSQRPFDQKWGDKIADNFDPDLFDPIVVTKANGHDGKHHIVEGQHRKYAAETALGKDQSLPCRVLGEADPARAAKVWLGINKGRKAPRPIQEFLVCVEAEEPNEVAITAIVKKAGYRVTNEADTDNVIRAVSALRSVYLSYKGPILLHTLQCCRLLWGGDPKGVAGQMIKGLAMFLNEFQTQVDITHLQKAITNSFRSPWKFIDAAKNEAEKSGENLDVAVSETARVTYNRGRREGSKLKRKD